MSLRNPLAVVVRNRMLLAEVNKLCMQSYLNTGNGRLRAEEGRARVRSRAEFNGAVRWQSDTGRRSKASGRSAHLDLKGVHQTEHVLNSGSDATAVELSVVAVWAKVWSGGRFGLPSAALRVAVGSAVPCLAPPAPPLLRRP